jgi:hypothetical protein
MLDAIQRRGPYAPAVDMQWNKWVKGNILIQVEDLRVGEVEKEKNEGQASPMEEEEKLRIPLDLSAE